MSFSGGLERMTISAYEQSDFSGLKGEITVSINPEKYTHQYKILYNDVQAQGSSGGSSDFNKIPADKVDFELVFDGTGVIPSPLPGVIPFTEDGIAQQIEKFKNLVFTYNGKIHSPNFLELTWGTFFFQCRLFTLNISYTLFKPDGTPLRARATASFIEYNDEVTLELKAGKSSPDVSHVLTVEAGDTLPLMCNQIYNSSAYYIGVARANNLSGFRDVKIGRQLIFPPLEEKEESE